MPIRIILTDDHPIISDGIKNLLKDESEIEIIGEFRNGHSLLQSSLLSTADILLLDLNMPKVDGLQVLANLKANQYNLKTIIISAYKQQKLIEECEAAGADAYIIKTQSLIELKNVIYNVLSGIKVFPDLISQVEDNDNFSYLDEFLNKHKITKREAEIIQLICRGKTSNEIADDLNLSSFTIQTHRKNIFKKLALDNSNLASLYDFANNNGLL